MNTTVAPSHISHQVNLIRSASTESLLKTIEELEPRSKAKVLEMLKKFQESSGIELSPVCAAEM